LHSSSAPEHETGDALGRLERGVERHLAARRASHQPGGRIRRHGVEHGKQVIDVPEGRAGRRHVTEPSPVIRDNVSSGCTEPRAHLAPAAPVAHARVKQDNRCAGAVPAITDERRAPGHDLHRLIRHAASLLPAFELTLSGIARLASKKSRGSVDARLATSLARGGSRTAGLA